MACEGWLLFIFVILENFLAILELIDVFEICKMPLQCVVKK